MCRMCDGSPAAMTSEVLNGLVTVGERHILHLTISVDL